MKLLGVDLGDARTGISVSDESGSFAFPLCVIKEYNSEKLAQKVADLAIKENAAGLVVGLPKNMDGSEGFRAQACRKTGEKIAELAALPLVMWDERCTTVIAHNELSKMNAGAKKRKETVDAAAAVLILESYLNYKKQN